ncbi:MAG: hypothetical protein MUO72_00990 [Bacteroidales bacterium]|nr:hypothetical protein [Bacteroidales bacterium]
MDGDYRGRCRGDRFNIDYRTMDAVCQDIGAFLVFGLIGIGFCWGYSTNRERLWWTIIPDLGLFTLLAAVLSDYFVGTDPENDWISVLVMGLEL